MLTGAASQRACQADHGEWDLKARPSGYETYFDGLTCYGLWTGVVQIWRLTWANVLHTVSGQG